MTSNKNNLHFFITILVLLIFNFKSYSQDLSDVIVEDSAKPNTQQKPKLKPKQPLPATLKKQSSPNKKLKTVIKPDSRPSNTDTLTLTPEPIINKPTSINESTLTLEEPPKSKFKNRHAVTIDYNTWYEMLKIKEKTSGTYVDSKSHYFGVGLYYDLTIYEEKYGYALTFGAISGSGQVGSEGANEYYQKRIPWYGLRTGARVFYRANNRVDIGPAVVIQYKQTNWPDQSTFQVQPQSNPQYFIYIDTRWRLSYPLELIQSFGAHTRQQALVWKLGFNYTLN